MVYAYLCCYGCGHALVPIPMVDFLIDGKQTLKDGECDQYNDHDLKELHPPRADDIQGGAHEVSPRGGRPRRNLS